MKTLTQIKAAWQSYIVQFPQEKESLTVFADFLNGISSDTLLYDRKNFKGHITASSFIIDLQKEQLLLLEHKSLQRWLQPGGHIDDTDLSILDAALRECKEETNIDRELLHWHQGPFSRQIPLDIDSHLIPQNDRKQEEAHYHHDFRYLFLYKGEKDIAINPEESCNHKWVSFTQLETDDTFARVIAKIRLCF